MPSIPGETRRRPTRDASTSRLSRKQQYADFIADVPTIGALFLLNGLAAGAVTILLATRRAALGALAAIALSAGALVAVLISMAENGLFGYTEPAFRAAVVVAVAAEVAAVVLLLAYLALRRAPAIQAASTNRR
ncbi:MAG: hypothetical protein M3N04_07270 [Actinomycetota bacterium]|nr:hypothetical protein [Actinomycetota bacterium]